MLPFALVSAPFTLLAGNPVFGYNVVLFLAFILNAMGMFALVRRLTGSCGAGVVSGIIFSFSSYNIMHISHLQLVGSMGIPWCFLFLHKLLTDKTWGASLMFSFFFALQALICVYYGLFFTAVLILVLPLFLFFEIQKPAVSFLIKLGVPLAAAVGVLYVFSLPYGRVFQSLGLKRALTPGAEVQNYLAPVPPNFLFGKLLSGLGTHEKFLFPGLAACVLSAVAVAGSKRKARKAFQSRATRLAGKTVKAAFLVFVGVNVITLIAALAGGIRIKWGPLRLSANRIEKPALYLFLLCALFLAAKVAGRLRARPPEDRSPWILGYSVLTFWAMLLSFGAGFALLGKTTMLLPMPFPLFYRYVKGFTGIREPVRFAVFVIFGVAVLAGFGYERVMRRMKKPLKAVLAVALLIFINVEYLSIPLESVSVPVRKDIPPVYEWLKEQREGAVVLELPFSDWLPGESLFVYFSAYHKKRIVNGYS
jgi:hypothetical protein